MAKKIVLSGYFGFKNFGDEAILSVLVNKLQDFGHSLTVISSDPDYTKSQYKNINSVYTFSLWDVITSIFKSEVLISGGGSLLQDSTSLKSLFYYLFVLFVGIIFGKRVIIFAQGIGPINNPFGLAVTRFLLNKCHFISVRDTKSFDLLSSFGIKSELVCDPIFSLKCPENHKEKKIAIQLRNCKGINEDFIDRLAQSVNIYFSDYKVEIYSFQDLLDLEICKKFEKSLTLLNPDIDTVLYSGLTNSEIVDNISKCEYLIGMRFHSLIIGLLSGVKLLGINYDIKVEKLANEFDFPVVNFKEDIADKMGFLKNQDNEKMLVLVKNKRFEWKNFIDAIEN